MTDEELKLCKMCGSEFLLDLSNPSRYLTKKKGKDVWICPECREIFTGEG